MDHQATREKESKMKQYIEKIYAITPRADGWRALQTGNRVMLGSGVMLGGGMKLGNDVMLGNGVRLGSGVKLGNHVRLGNYVRLGNNVILGNDVILDRHDIICAGRDIRGWEVLGLRTPEPIITAGCRWFAPEEAREHWAENLEVLIKVEYLISEMNRLGWLHGGQGA